MQRTVLAVCVGVLICVSSLDGPVSTLDASSQHETRSETPVFDLDVKGRYGRAPADLTVLVTVRRAADNRAVRVAIDSGSYYRASFVQLDGDRSPERQPIIWKGLPPGAYRLVGELVDAAGEVKSKAWTEIQIL